MTRRPLAAFALATTVVIAASSCSADPTSPIPPAQTSAATPASTRSTDTGDPVGRWRPGEGVETLASGLASPWSVVPLPGAGAIIAQRDDGALLELDVRGGLRPLGVVPGVVSGGESGLHGLALLDDGALWLYAYHGAQDDNRVVRMPLLGSPGGRGIGSAEPVVTGIPRARTHNGGRIAFGPDGLLYIATGDAGDPSAAQDIEALGGKILRVTPDGSPAPGNPFDSSVYSWGHRNVQGLAWTSDGTLWASEFGQNTWDELNRITPGANYGWPVHEGAGSAAGFTDPVLTWRTADASPSGVAAVGDTLFVAGLRGETLWIVDTDGGEIDGEPLPVLRGEQGRLRDAVAAPDGSIWVLTGNTDGRGSPRPEDDLLLRIPLIAVP